ncbi:[LysW]-aminoadipate kinase, partial [Candidatus Woesearchaeota archaeon]|nr:[LysW]-aminoadipate kinase [Candidatus Woesearchaeota archaeon]
MPINVDGDRFASIIASEMKADALIILSNVPGLLKNPDDESTLIKQIKKSEVSQFLGYAKERMKRKLMGAIEALEAGVRKVVFADARIENPIGNALNGNGTVIE